jgi:monoamine oxidase
MNLEQYFDSINLTGWLRSLLLVAYLGEYGLETNECNAINFLYLFGVSPEGSVALYGVSDERYKVPGGNQQIVDALASQFKNKIHLSHKLAKIKSTNAGGYELFFEGKNASVKADIVILTLPFTLLREVEIDVDLPDVKRKAIHTLSYGTNSKLLLGFNGRPWRTKYNSVGMSYSDNGTENTWDNSQLQPGNNGGLTVYFGGNDGIAVGQGSVHSQADKYLNLLNQIYPGVKNDFNNKAYRMVWPTFPFTKASYSAWSVGQYTTIAGSEIETVGNLYFAGEHTSYNFQGYMNGGAVTGRIAARSILRAMKKENNIAPPIAFNRN